MRDIKKKLMKLSLLQQINYEICIISESTIIQNSYNIIKLIDILDTYAHFRNPAATSPNSKPIKRTRSYKSITTRAGWLGIRYAMKKNEKK